VLKGFAGPGLECSDLTASSSKGPHLYMEYFLTFSSTKLSASSSTDFCKALREAVKEISDSHREKVFI